MGDINRTETSCIIPLNTDTITKSSKRMFTNMIIDKNCSKFRGRNNMKLNNEEPYQDNILISSVTKHKGKDINLQNVMSIKESKDEQDYESCRNSPYFSTNFKGFKTIKIADSMIASDGEDSNLKVNNQMNIREESLNIDPINIINQESNSININNSYSQLNKEQIQNKLNISTDLNISNKLSKIKENIGNVINVSVDDFNRKENFFENCAGINSIMFNRSASKTPCIPDSSKTNIFLPKNSKTTENNDYQFDEINEKNNKSFSKSLRLNKKMRRYKQRRENDQALPSIGRKGSRANTTLKMFFNNTFQPENSQVCFTRNHSGLAKHKTIIFQSLEAIDINELKNDKCGKSNIDSIRSR